MRPTRYLFPIFFASILFLGLPAQSADTAKVIPEHASIYSQASAKSSVVGSLERGHRVLVDLMVSDANGGWCLVREPDRERPSGYVLCKQLTQEALPRAQSSMSEVPQPRQSGGMPSPDRYESPATASTNDAMLSAIERWAVQLELSVDQRKKVLESFRDSGLAASRDDLAMTLQRYLVRDSDSMLKRSGAYAKRPFTDYFAAEVEPKVRRGGVRYRSFWQSFWRVLTHEQQEKASHITGFFLAYIASQSDPESAFLGSAMQQARRSRRTK